MLKLIFQENPSLQKAFLLSMLALILLGLPVLFMGNESLFLWVNSNCLPSLSWPAYFLSLLGESWAMGFLMILSLRMPLRNSLFIALTWISGAVHSWLFKLWLCKGWPRPYQYFMEKGQEQLLNLAAGVEPHHWNSFPSGHTITAFSLLLLLPVLFPKIKSGIVLLAWLLAFGCGISRIVLVQHWPVDVLGGIFLACSASFWAIFISGKIFQNPTFSERSLLSYFGRPK